MIVVPRQQIAVPRLGLSQILALNGGQSLIPRIKGWVQATTRRLPDCPRCGHMVRFDADQQDHVCDACGLDRGIGKGPITRQLAQDNLITREILPPLFSKMGDYYYRGLTTGWIRISNDDTGVHELKGVAETTMNGTVSAEVTPTKNTTAYYYTFTYTFPAPTANRIVRQIGLGVRISGGFYGSYSNGSWKLGYVASMTELSSEITQSTTETFEVVYKYQFSQVTP